MICESTSAYLSHLQKNYSIFPVRSGKQGILAIREHHAHAVVVDAVSIRTTGDRICRILRDEFPHLPILHIHPGSSQRIQSKADIVLVHPVPARTLLTNIDLLVHQQESEVLMCGPFAVDLDRKVIRLDGRELALTPKISALAEVFFRYPGKVLERKWLMQQIWNTDYVGDTRTLSVHIRYLRELLEPDPGQPQYIKTVRGTGYIFDCEE
jgi:DNA-binding response OmpR family regulator